MTGYIPVSDSEQEFKPGDVALNAGMFWRLDDGGWRIIGDNEYLPICSGCGQPKQPQILKAHQRECNGQERHASLRPKRRFDGRWRVTSSAALSGGLHVRR